MRFIWPLRITAIGGESSALFFDTGEICEVRLHTVTCLALNDVGKQHQTNNE